MMPYVYRFLLATAFCLVAMVPGRSRADDPAAVPVPEEVSPSPGIIDASPFQEELASLPPLRLPRLDPDVLTLSENWNLGISSLSMNVGNQNPSPLLSLRQVASTAAQWVTFPGLPASQKEAFDLDAELKAEHNFERHSRRLSVVSSVYLSLRPTWNRLFEGADQDYVTYDQVFNGALVVRFYPLPHGPDFFLTMGLQAMDWFTLAYEDDGKDTDFNHLNYTLFRFLPGLGYGRLLNYGPSIRLKKVEMVLRREGLLEDRIPEDVGDLIVQQWYELRNEIGYHRHLQYTFKALQDAGLLKVEPNLATTYAVLQILSDPSLDLRRKGLLALTNLDFWIQLFKFKDKDLEELKNMNLMMSLTYGSLPTQDQQFQLTSNLMVDLGVMDSQFVWFLWHTRPRFEWFLYNRVMDPVGSVELSTSFALATAADMGGVVWAGVSGGDLMTLLVQEDWLTVRFTAELAYIKRFDRGSSFRISFATGVDRIPSPMVNYLGLEGDVGYYVSFNLGYIHGMAQGNFSRYTHDL